jgi:peptidoglycan hydrolase CwlO-like protein
MIKKTAIVAGVALLLMGLLFGRDTVSYLSTFAGNAQDAVRNNIPIDLELSRARQMISQLDPGIRDAMHQIAKGEVKVDQLAAQRDQLKEQLAKSMDDIDRLRTDLEREDSTYVAGTCTRPGPRPWNR